jgi:hypothetical protein
MNENNKPHVHPLPKCPSCGNENISFVSLIITDMRGVHAGRDSYTVNRYSLLMQCNDCKTSFVSGVISRYQPFEIIPPKQITSEIMEKFFICAMGESERYGYQKSIVEREHEEKITCPKNTK